MKSPATLRAFVVRVALLLPPCFAAWYFTAAWHASIVGPLAVQLVQPWRTGLVSELERSGHVLSFVTGLEIGSSGGQVGQLVVDVNPLVYTYGLALFLALMLATRSRAWQVLLGAAIMLVFQASSVAFDFLVQVAVLSGPEVAARAGLAGWQREVIALGHQFSTLIFPGLVPVLLWGAFNRAFIAGLREEAVAARLLHEEGVRASAHFP